MNVFTLISRGRGFANPVCGPGEEGLEHWHGEAEEVTEPLPDMHSHLNSSIISKGGMEVTDPPPAKHNPRGLQVRNP